MTKKSVFARLLFGALLAVGPVGCSRFKPPGQEAMGTVTFFLTATGASGTVYRLRSATFMVTGPENKSIVSPTDPADTLPAITSQLLPGTYQITLATGWQMWRIPAAGTPVAVSATLISPSMVSFTVVSAQDSKVVYQFDIMGETLVPGTVTIGIGVTEVDAGVGGSPDAGAPGTSGGAGGAAGAAGGTAGAGGGTAGAAGGAAGAGGASSGTAGAAGGAAGAAGTGGAAGAPSTCGNGIVDPGEQCDSAAAFANNTCDRHTCQLIPIVCGNHLVQPGEQCDDGPAGSFTCSPTCMTIVPASPCLTCETQGTTAGVCLGTKVAASSPVGCAGLSSADATTKCMTLLNCLETHPNCSIGGDHTAVNSDPTDCFCGTLTAASCSGAPSASIAGACASAYFAVYGGVSDANRDNVLQDFFARALPVGMANNLYACDVNNNCQSKCP